MSVQTVPSNVSQSHFYELFDDSALGQQCYMLGQQFDWWVKRGVAWFEDAEFNQLVEQYWACRAEVRHRHGV